MFKPVVSLVSTLSRSILTNTDLRPEKLLLDVAGQGKLVVLF